jgi:hypothetical protein
MPYPFTYDNDPDNVRVRYYQAQAELATIQRSVDNLVQLTERGGLQPRPVPEIDPDAGQQVGEHYHGPADSWSGDAR